LSGRHKLILFNTLAVLTLTGFLDLDRFEQRRQEIIRGVADKEKE